MALHQDSTAAIANNPLLFPQSTRPFNKKLFQQPTAEYRGNPLWSWNTRLEQSKLLQGIDALQEMGFGGFHIHCRVGLDTEYLGPEFLEYVKGCADYAAKKDLLCCLYDEDRWPSGYAGGLTLEGHPEHRAKHLLFTPRKYGEGTRTDVMQGAHAGGVRSELGELVARYEITLNKKTKTLASFKRLADTEEPSLGSTLWYAYLEPNPPSEWYNGDTYLDTLSEAAVARFIETTHEKYADIVGHLFSTVVPSIFTDEPQFAHKTQLLQVDDLTDVFLPWTDDFSLSFEHRYGYDILAHLPLLVWDAPDLERAEVARYHFHDHVCERFVDAFMDQIATWCRNHGILLIGHMMKEPTLLSQTQALGEAMRCYRNLDVPGVDILTDLLEYNTVKQCTSVAHQNGARGSMSEIYGVTGWSFDFRGHKASGDWQAALGITFRVHHLAWVSMEGEAKRDFPAAISYQSNWYREYHHVEDHFSRLNVALTRGRPQIRVAVIHPIESYWLCFGPLETNRSELLFRDSAFADLTNWLLFGLIDFDFVSESLLPSQCPSDDVNNSGRTLGVGAMEYEAVILPNLRTIRSSTLERVRAFANSGGKVIIAGEAPTLVDAKTPDTPLTLENMTHVPFTNFHILRALEDFRDIRIVTTDEGQNASTFMYNMRDDGDSLYLFICNTDRRRYYPTRVAIKGEFGVDVLDTLTGDEWRLETELVDGWTEFNWHFEAIESLLLRLQPVTANLAVSKISGAQRQFPLRSSLKTVASEVHLDSVELDEKNVLLLDRASWRLEGEDSWHEETEILHAENDVRRHLGIPQKLEAFRQPWRYSAADRAPVATVHLKFDFASTVAVDGEILLALEQPEAVRVLFDGVELGGKTTDHVTGWWVDRDIHTVRLPGSITAGKHSIELILPFSRLSNMERLYLLGDFGVQIRGQSATIGPLNLRDLTFGDWTPQGLPFYAGNVTYHCSFTTPADFERGTRLFVEIPRFCSPVLTVSLDGASRGPVYLDPHTLELGSDFGPRESHTLDVTCFGNRDNAFGPIHKPEGGTRWIAANTFRAEHENWTEEYTIKKMGVLQRPRLKVVGKEIYHVQLNPTKTWIL
ncbi:hypothetical protein A1O3_06157 [Capronia epimyces CBS 606.96]|uniref:Uncharacterized protein n=1 Tax=Capronia epimyces CBS 606.96 TaxID=1182542 RepID=W9YJC1_9EURO|nr:uncharacterized protein A1O3_06157 [Capronia epimyces CBS 606.96]EXJ82344.1 hypothetical protein A1O3_06157 [Capronia epimyces CBS 606.96]